MYFGKSWEGAIHTTYVCMYAHIEVEISHTNMYIANGSLAWKDQKNPKTRTQTNELQTKTQ